LTQAKIIGVNLSFKLSQSHINQQITSPEMKQTSYKAGLF